MKFDRLKKPLPYILILSCLIIYFLPMFINGIPVSHDGDYHVSWTHFFVGQVRSGDIYPRFLTEISDGFGAPNFYYYAPLPYYLNLVLSVFFPAVLSLPDLLAAAFFLAFVLGAIGTYLATKSITNRAGTFVSILAYSSLPYHLFIDAYSRGAYSEVFAMGVLPFLFIRFYDYNLSKRWILPIVSIPVAAMFLSHPPTALISLPLAFLYHSIILLSGKRWTDGIFYLTGCVIGGLLASFYLLPAFLIENSVLYKLWDQREIVSVSVFGMSSKFAVALSFSILVTLLISLTIFVHQLLLREKVRKEILVIVFLCVFFMSPLSLFFYKKTLLYKIQFPWRFMTVMTFMASMQIGLFYGKQPKRRSLRAIVLSVLVLGGMIHLPLIRAGYIENFSDERVEQLIQSRFNTKEYTIVTSIPEMFENNDERVLPKNNLDSVKQWTENRIELTGNFRPGDRLYLRRAAFGSWVVDPSETSSYLIGTTEQGNLFVDILKPTSNIVVVQKHAFPVVMGGNLSLLGLLTLLISMVYFSFRPARRNQSAYPAKEYHGREFE